MTEGKFYTHVSSWIRSYRDANALQNLLPFIKESRQPDDVKLRLLREIERKTAFLQRKPHFEEYKNTLYLSDADGHPCLYTSRFAAVCKLTELKLRGYNAVLEQGSAFFKIALQPAPVSHESLAA